MQEFTKTLYQNNEQHKETIQFWVKIQTFQSVYYTITGMSYTISQSDLLQRSQMVKANCGTLETLQQ
mgnify:CR=1 FL=1